MNDKRFSFWLSWLKIASVLVIAFGLFMAATSVLPKEAPSFIDNQVNKAFFASEKDITKSMMQFQAWEYGVGGSMLIAWGFLILLVSIKALAKKEKWAWNAITGSLFIWFVIDEPISTIYHVTFNMILNIGFLLIFVIPLIFIKKEIARKEVIS